MVKVVSRANWGARAPRSRKTIGLPVKENWLHHTAGSESGAAGMRSIQKYHMDTKGWSDIGYSWVYDKDERTWYEGRGWGASGAHTYGHNSVSHGFCVMGNFQSESVPQSLIDDVAWLVWQAYKAGKGPAKLTGGHRDVASTACPGSNLYAKIPAINAKVQELISGKTSSGSAPTYDTGTGTLGVGDSGTHVRNLQSQLNDTGFDAGAVDGDFGPKTEGAVKRAQQKLGLTVDGLFGPNTRKALNEYTERVLAPKEEPVPETKEETSIDHTKAVGLVRIGSNASVFQAVGEYLVPVTSPAQAEVLAKVHGGGSAKWQDHVVSITPEQAAVFKKLPSKSLPGGGEHTHGYASKSHSHDFDSLTTDDVVAELTRRLQA